jgi:N utilization substance protein B
MAIINSKSLARLAAVQTVYSIYNQENPDVAKNINKIEDLYESEIIKEEFIDEDSKHKIILNKNLYREICSNIFSNLDVIHEIISNNLSKEWQLDKIHHNLKAILVCAVSELSHMNDTPIKVIVSEYTNIASSMINEHEVGFVNSILDKIAKEIRR